jgi:CHAT domain-containing protein
MSKTPRSLPSRRATVVVLALMGAAVVAAVGFVAREKARDERTLLMLAVRSDGVRTTTARLAGFPYGRPIAHTRGPSARSLSLEAQLAIASIRARYEHDASAQGLRHVARALLVAGHGERAVATLQRAEAIAPADALVQSDLAAAYLERADEDTHPDDVARALAAAERAIAREPSTLEAWFNRALALERLPVPDLALEAWRDYLARDRESTWRGEATEHARSLEGSGPGQRAQAMLEAAVARADRRQISDVARQWPATVRVHLDETLWPAWAGARRDRQFARATQLRAAIELVAKALSEATADRLPIDTVRFATRVDGRHGDALADAWVEYGHARDLASRDRVTEAEAHYQRAFEGFARVGSPFQAWARYYLARMLQLHGDAAGVHGSLEPLRAQARRNGYVAVAAMSAYTDGLMHRTNAQFDLAVDRLREALELYLQLGDLDGAGSARVDLAAAMDELGERAAGWRYRTSALGDAARTQSPRARHIIYMQVARACLADQLPECSLAIADAGVANAEVWRQQGAFVETSLARARAFMRLGRTDASREALLAAERTLDKVTDRNFASRWETDLLEGRAELEAMSADPTQVGALDAAIRDFRQQGRAYRVVNTYLLRARMKRRAGDLDGALADLQEGSRAFEGQWAAIQSNPMQLSAFDRAWDLYRELVDLAMRRDLSDLALLAGERSRGRALLSSVQRSVPSEDPARLAIRALPQDALLLFYTSLDDRLLVWVLGRGQASVRMVPLGRAELTRLIEEYRRVIGEGFDRTNSASARTAMDLHRHLLAPVRGHLSGVRTIVVVPDGPLSDLPFAALIDDQTRRYVIEDHLVLYGPSLTLFAAATARLARHSDPPASVLAVGVSRSADIVGAMPVLDAADAEARHVASLYPRGASLVGPLATKAHFLAEAGKAQVVHFAGHAVADPLRPLYSRLLFADAGGKPSPLFVRDLAALRLNSAQLVVLAACQTSTGMLTRSEGVASVTRSFIAAGVPVVVGSLWDVSDRMSQVLLGDFHQRVAAGGDGLAALRDAQLAFLHHANLEWRQPRHWAVYAMTGGLPAITTKPKTRSTT